jgi:UDP-N-acetylmuramate dehydrogenase
LPLDAPQWPTVEDDGKTVKLSAAWLIEQAGVHKGFSLPRSQAAISSKHALAITNRGTATANEVAELARYVQLQVSNKFGITLVPEPNLIGF